jgi:hypothetical protein
MCLDDFLLADREDRLIDFGDEANLSFGRGEGADDLCVDEADPEVDRYKRGTL